uniref:Uncharacterized protein n=1 Tax=Parascaris equorum TaxID=6256 RepID=A0A914S1M3_PAREQ
METVWERAAEMLVYVRPYLRYLLHQSKLVVRDRTVLITGASSGLGRELAIKFYRQGAKLILTARSIDKLKDLCEQLKGMRDVENKNEPVYNGIVRCVLTANRINSRYEYESSVFFNLDKFVHFLWGVLLLCATCSFQLMEVNYFGHVAVTKALLDYIPDDGAILVTSSLQGRIAVPYRSAYSASKHAAQGEPINKDDENQAKGMNPTVAAEKIYTALVNRQTELVLAPFHHRFAIFIRWFSPNLFFWLNYRRGLKDAHAKHD